MGGKGGPACLHVEISTNNYNQPTHSQPEISHHHLPPMSIRIAASRSVSSAARAVFQGPAHDISITCKFTHNRGAALRFRRKSSVSASDASRGATKNAAKEPAKEAAAAEAASSSTSESIPLGTTLVAMSLAIATVSAAAFIAENATASLVPKFDPKAERFDQSMFIGRFSKMLLGCDPSLLLYSDDEVRKCKAMVDDFEHHLTNLPDGVSEAEMSRKLWEAQRVASAALVRSF